MFYETLSTLSWNGDIGWAFSRDGINWRHGGIAVDEPFHLSFPTVFTWAGAYYMMPETHGNNTIALYKAVTFPHTWALHRLYFPDTAAQLGGGFVDHIIRHVPASSSLDGTDTVFMLTYEGGTDRMHLFWMDASSFPEGDWTKHPASPLNALSATGLKLNRTTVPPWTPRTCGPLVPVGRHLLRFAQYDGESVYGWNITALSRTVYAESPAGPPPLFPSRSTRPGLGWRAGGMHTLDAHPLDADGKRWIVAVDGRKDSRHAPY